MLPPVHSREVGRFMDLFAGNPACYGRGDELGGCAWHPPTFDLFRDHLTGAKPIGIYPVDPEKNETKWGCFDIDEERPEWAEALQEALGKHRVPSVREVSRRKGYHVWVFSEDPVAPRTMRYALLAIRQELGLDGIKEVNPKQIDFPMMVNGHRSPGNYVRLPYPRLGLGGRQVFIEGGRKLSFLDGLALAEESRSPVLDVQRLALRYLPPDEKKEWSFSSMDFDGEFPEGTPGYVRKMVEEGPLEDEAGVIDRSGWLVRVAGKCHEMDMSAEDAFTCLVLADNVVGKYANRNDREQRLTEIIERVY